MSGQNALALALYRGQSPNILEVSIAGGNYQYPLMALCDGNRRAAISLLELTKKKNYALSEQDCLGIQQRLPAMLSIAEAKGATASRHAMGTRDLISILERIRDYAEQYKIDTGAEAQIERLYPANIVASIDRAPDAVAASPATTMVVGR
ncbi:MAG: hypothetical protein ACOYNL_08375 [Rickettsiales bacterium]